MESPITGKPMKLVHESGTKLVFRKEEFEITYHYYLCEDSNEKFTTDELDIVNQNQVHNLYREKYGIPFTEEIKAIRKKYNVSANKMSEILGMGANTYRLYEEGEIPSVSNGRLILAIKHPKDFIKQVEASTHLFGKKDIEKFIHNAESILEHEKENQWDIMFTKHIFSYERPNEFTGYCVPNINKIAQIISYFTKDKDVFKTKLNKLLFYTDFGNYKTCGSSMTGITYRAIQMGPVPSEYSKMYSKLCDDHLISIKSILFTDGNYNEAIVGSQNFDETQFSESEKMILELVKEKLLEKKTEDIVDLSHNEKAWISNEKNRELISYQKFAFELKNI